MLLEEPITLSNATKTIQREYKAMQSRSKNATKLKRCMQHIARAPEQRKTISRGTVVQARSAIESLRRPSADRKKYHGATSQTEERSTKRPSRCDDVSPKLHSANNMCTKDNEAPRRNEDLCILDEVGNHDDGRCPLLPHHGPEVVHCVREGPLGGDVGARSTSDAT